MTPTLVGLAVIPFSIYLFLFRPDWLVPALVASVPFSATAVLNIESISFGLQSYHVLGALLLIRWTFWPSLTEAPSRPGGDISTVWLALFAIAVLTSLYVPILQGRLSLYHLTQTAYLLFGLSTSFVVSRVAANRRILIDGISWFLWSNLFVSCWAIFQFICFNTAIPYPDWLFNNSVSESATFFDQVIEEYAMPRVSSVAVEPSFLARQLLSALAVALGLMQTNIGERRLPLRSLAAVYIAVLVLCTSSTAYFGLSLLFLYVVVRLPRTALAAIPVGAIIGSLALLIIPNLAGAIYVMTIGKSSGGSFMERFSSVMDGMIGFAEAPWIGNGWGAVNSWDLGFKLLSNVGVFGALAFFAFTASLLAPGAMAALGRHRPIPALNGISEALSLAVMIALAVDAVAGFSFATGNIWLLFGLLWAACALLTASRDAELIQ
ncbi:hypothetical protein JL101_029440 (plasmid) [Skermanella rosea]|uniref:hypothetical protein n=1 Tax=Skermanella rosea TaxID=1817965 RepID=UPI001933BEF0|nr:hypothetical protein [Skermanella rosea]UEM07123.1 hypothetical protein JL101_029440 [Skermanella rosea]